MSEETLLPDLISVICRAARAFMSGPAANAIRASLPGQTDVSLGEISPALIVPQVHSSDTGQPQSWKFLLRSHVDPEHVQRVSEDRHHVRQRRQPEVDEGVSEGVTTGPARRDFHDAAARKFS